MNKIQNIWKLLTVFTDDRAKVREKVSTMICKRSLAKRDRARERERGRERGRGGEGEGRERERER